MPAGSRLRLVSFVILMALAPAARVPAQATCASILWPSSRGVPSSGGSFTVQVEAPPTCQWSITTPPWITATPDSGSANGSGNVTVTVSPNTSLHESGRSGFVVIGGRGVDVIQPGPPAPWWRRLLSAGSWNPWDGTLVSDDGRVVVTTAQRIVTDPVNGPTAEHDLLVFDPTAGVGSPLAVSAVGEVPFTRALSSDGRLLLYGKSGIAQMYLLDLPTRVSTPLAPPDGSLPVWMDGTGTFFTTRGGSPGSEVEQIWNRTTNQIVASLPSSFAVAGEQRIRRSTALSADGSTVLLSVATVAIPPAVPQVRPFQRWRWQTGEVTDVPLSTGVSLMECSRADVNGDGMRVLFAANGTCTLTTQHGELHMFDAATGTTTLVTRKPNGDPTTIGFDTLAGLMDASGRYVLLMSSAGDLTAETFPLFPGALRLYRRDVATGTTERIRVRELEPVAASANAPAVAPGYRGVRMSGDGQHLASTFSLLTRAHPIPGLQVTSITPASVALQTDTTVTVTGAGLTPGMTLMVDGQNLPDVTVQSPSSLTARIPAALGFAARIADVRAMAPGGASAALADAFRFSSCDEDVWTLAPQSPFAASNNLVTVASSGGATVPFSITTASPCRWTLEPDPGVTWFTVVNGSGQGSGIASVSVAPLPPQVPSRAATMRLRVLGSALRSLNLQQLPTPPCSYTVTPSNLTVPPAGGTASVSVQTDAGCGWTVGNLPSWITASPMSGTGPSTVSLVATPAFQFSRLESISIAGRPISVSQGVLTCTFTVVPGSVQVPAGGGQGTIRVTASAPVCGVTVSPSAQWVALTGGSGIGSWDVSYSVAPNPTSATRTSSLVTTPPHAPIPFVLTQAGIGEPLPPPHTRYFAEGATSSFFDTRLAVLNPGDVDATATITFARGNGSAVVKELPVPARRRVTLDPKTIPGMESAEFSTRIGSDQPLVIDRMMTWNVAGGYGAHAEGSIQAPALTWYLAEGSTVGGFNLFYLLQNPNSQAAEVRVRFLRPSGTPLEKTYTLFPSSRTNIWVNVEEFGDLGKALAHEDVSAVIEVANGQPIIVERAMYLDVPLQAFGAGHESAGVTTPATEWFLAEGATGPFFDLFALVANPTPTDARIEATYLLPDGSVLTRPYTVAANSRFNIWVDLEDPQLANTAVSTIIRSLDGVPIIVERAMWWPGGGWYEAHNSPGATTTGTTWALAEGEVGGPRGVSTYILLANTSPTDGQVQVTLLFEDGTSAARIFPVTARSRFNVDARHEFPQAANRRFGAIVESVGEAPVQLVVERAMYWDALGATWAAGTNALATKLK